MFFFVVLLLFINTSILAQEIEREKSFRISILGSISIPTGSFGKSLIEEGAGYALVGGGAGLEFAYGTPIANWISNVYLSFNGYNEGVLQKQMEIGVDVEAGSYTTVWLLTGFSAGIDLVSRISLLGFIQGGLLVSKYPELTISNSTESVTTTSDMATSAAYSFGAGMKISNISILMRYYFGKPEYELTISTNRSRTEIKSKAELPASLVTLMFGITI